MREGIRWYEFISPESVASRVAERQGKKFGEVNKGLATRARQILEHEPERVEELSGGELGGIPDPNLRQMMREMCALKVAEMEQVGDHGWSISAESYL